jgi:two-component system OmpR family sensor kinase
VALDPLVADLLRQARLLAPDRAVTQAVEPGLVAVGDRDALRQILLNLLENAFRHTPVTATVRLEAKGQADAVVLRVADSGPGIAPEDLDRVFERFQRGHAARTGPGSGLGLSIARALTEAQGGTIEVTSTVGVGTAFTVRLPREAGVSSSHAPSPGA